MRRLLPPASAIVVALGLLCSAATPPDEPAAPIELVWHAPMACPGKQHVLNEIARRIGRRQRPIHAEAIVTREAADLWRARIRLSGDVEGARDLTAESCDVLSRAAALIIALAVDPQAASVLSQEIQQAEERQAEPPRKPEPEPEPEPREPPTKPRAEAPPGLQVLVHSGMLVEYALVPDLAVGGLLGVGAQYAWLRADLTLSFVPLASATVEGGRGADLSAATLAIRGCAVPDLGALEAGLCVGLNATRLWAAGTGVPESFTRHGDMLAVSLGPLLRWPADSDWAVELSGETVIPTSHPAFVVENLGTVFEVPSVGVTGALAFGYRF